MTTINANSLIGQRVTVRGNDFVGEPTYGYIRFVDLATDAVLIELDVPVETMGVRYGRSVASPRLQRDNLDTLIKLGTLGCGITWIPETRYDPRVPFDLSWWRGGAAAIADVVLGEE